MGVGQCGSNQVVTGMPEPGIYFPKPPLDLWAGEFLETPEDIFRRATAQCKYRRACGWSARWCERFQPWDISRWPPGPGESSTQKNLEDIPSRWDEGHGNMEEREPGVRHCWCPDQPLPPPDPTRQTLQESEAERAPE